MSLSTAQKQATCREFTRNLELLGITPHDIAVDLGISQHRIEDIIGLRNVRHLEDAWVVRRYLLDRAARDGIQLIPFSALKGDPTDYWFLDTDRIERMELD